MKPQLLIAASFVALFPNLDNKDARAAEVKSLAAVGVREIITELTPQFESATGHKLLSTFDASGPIVAADYQSRGGPSVRARLGLKPCLPAELAHRGRRDAPVGRLDELIGAECEETHCREGEQYPAVWLLLEH